MHVIWFIAKQIDVLAYMNKIAIEMIKIDEIENIGNSLHNKRKNIFKQRDDQIAAITEFAVNSGMRLIDIDFEQNIVNGPTYAFEYSTTNISCTYPQHAIERNKGKRDILEYLLNQTMIKSFPYEMYFMSCNLDHALYNEINLNKDLKQEYADEFYEKFIGKEYLFPAFLESDVVNEVPDNMGASWRYIKEGLHSLERHTNLHIYFKTHPNPDGLL